MARDFTGRGKSHLKLQYRRKALFGDSGSSAHSGRAGSSPASRTRKKHLLHASAFFNEINPLRDL